MSIGTETFSLPSVDAPFPVRRFSVEEYQRMAETGVLTEDDRVELLEGWITPKMVHNPPHDAAVCQLQDDLPRLLPNGWTIRVQCSLTTSDSQPEPDVAVVRGKASDYRKHHPTSADTALVIEVAESSLRRDRLKCRLYARAEIAVYWIVNLVDSQIEVYTNPSGPGDSPSYGEQKIYAHGDTLPLVIAGEELATIKVDDLLP